ncbi:MAG: class I SAM-dependent methyltransferase [Anaerolineales bacterium]|nr:MAG: class I SAM-dependent methyltransferase [Anaerolineales bacterium]
MDEKSTVKDGYNSIAAKYLPTRSEDSEDVQLLQELVERLPKGAKVLDAGCGAGIPVARYLIQFFDVTGVDFSNEQIRMARQLVPEAHFLCQDITQLTLVNNSFDAICSYYAIIHVPRREHQALLHDFHRMLKPSGLVLLCLGADDLEKDFHDYHGARMYWSHYDAKTNLNLIKECGFSIIWSKVVADSTSPGSSHLFVLAQKDCA